jgi:hypothetical protein
MTTLSAVMLWTLLKNMQTQMDLTKAKGDEHIMAGTQVEVIEADVGVFHLGLL